MLEPAQISTSRHPRAKRASSSMSASCDRLRTATPRFRLWEVAKRQSVQSARDLDVVTVAAAAAGMLVVHENASSLRLL